MIAFLVMLLTGFGFGYLIVGPFNRGYTPLAWAGVMAVCGTSYGVLIITALTVVAPLNDPSRPVNLGQVYLALLFTTMYALAATVGTYVYARSHR